MLCHFITIANEILFFMMLLSEQFGWYNQIRIVMLMAFIFMVILEVYSLAKCNNKETKWTLREITFWLILDLAGFLYFSGIWQ
ncbi:MAG TPA: hypothetical protein DEQ17_02370 [Prevotella sp.]|nr:hypothetical protein [Prevotella sp.]